MYFFGVWHEENESFTGKNIKESLLAEQQVQNNQYFWVEFLHCNLLMYSFWEDYMGTMFLSFMCRKSWGQYENDSGEDPWGKG